MSVRDRIILAIEQRSKAVPYPSEKRKDSVNIGFHVLKGVAAEAIGKIPEVQDCSSLKDALIAINQSHTRFFTVGCEKSLNTTRGMFWKKGYLEFSYNHAECVKDAISYFVLFFHFHRKTAEYAAQRAIRYVWDLQPARFKQLDAVGFTCCVWIETDPIHSRAECEDVWDAAVKDLADYLVALEPLPLPPIYPAET